VDKRLRHLHGVSSLFGTLCEKDKLMQEEKSTQGKSNTWFWVVVGAITIAGFMYLSQSKKDAEYNEALMVTGAKIECNAEASRDDSKNNNCSKLGTPGYERMTRYYYNAYKHRTGIKGL
jgi:hypothetical protein